MNKLGHSGSNLTVPGSLSPACVHYVSVLSASLTTSSLSATTHLPLHTYWVSWSQAQPLQTLPLASCSISICHLIPWSLNNYVACPLKTARFSTAQAGGSVSGCPAQPRVCSTENVPFQLPELRVRKERRRFTNTSRFQLPPVLQCSWETFLQWDDFNQESQQHAFQSRPIFLTRS